MIRPRRGLQSIKINRDINDLSLASTATLEDALLP